MKFEFLVAVLLGACSSPEGSPAAAPVTGATATWSIADMRISPDHSMDLGSKLLVVAPRAGWMGVQPEGRDVIARDLFGPDTIAPAGAMAVAFREPQGEAWFLVKEGAAVACSLKGESPLTPVALDSDLDTMTFAPGGRALVGYDRGADALTLIRVGRGRACEEVRRFEGVRSLASGRAMTPPCAFSPDGTLVAFAGGRGFARPGASERRIGLGGVVVEAETGDVVAEFAPYVASRSPGFTFAGKLLAHGRRVSDHRWAIDLVGRSSRATVDDDARGGHFTDLVAEPSGRWLAEGDFEDRTPRVHDLLGRRPIAELESGQGIALGFVPRAGDEEPVLLVGDRDARLRAIGSDGGILVDEHAELRRSLGGYGQIDGAVATKNGRAIAVAAWSARPGSTTIHRQLRILVAAESKESANK